MSHEKTIVLPNDGNAESSDLVSTRVIANRELEVDGAKFQWWAVGENPTLVTVRSPIFGSRAKFTVVDPAYFAERLAKTILLEHYRRATAYRSERNEQRPQQPATPIDAFKKPGWFKS